MSIKLNSMVLLTDDFEDFKAGDLLLTTPEKSLELVSAGIATSDPATVDAELGKSSLFEYGI